MRSSSIALAVGLLAAPLALLTTPDTTVTTGFPRLLADAPVPHVGPVDQVAGNGGLILDADRADTSPDDPAVNLSK